MAIPKIDNQNIADALKYIDENGIPEKNRSTKYELVAEDGKRYPPKYVIGVANHLATGEAIITEGYNTIEATNYFQARGYGVEMRQEKYVLTIEADKVESTDERFDIHNLFFGDNYQPIDVFLKRADGEIIRRKRNRSENRISNKTMSRIAFQVFEKDIAALSEEQRHEFPTCQYTPKHQMICGIFPNETEYRKYKNSIEYDTYISDTGAQYVIYAWNIFSTILFVQECLKRFGTAGDQFVLTYREKDEKEEKQEEIVKSINEELVQQFKGYQNPYSSILAQSKNIILRGAPGTGKSYLAKEIAADIISNGYFDKYTLLSDEQKKQVEFVQFHPGYDYSDFVEGLRPKLNDDGSMGFELKDGVFKKFVARARKNYEDSQKSMEDIKQALSAQESMNDFFENIEFGIDKFKTIKGSEFLITGVDENHIFLSIPGNNSINKLSLNIDELRRMLEANQTFEKVSDVTKFFGKQFATQGYSYDFVLYKEIKERYRKTVKSVAKPEELKKYIFIIDEINRGEISKIFGELFFSIDPGYRGKGGEVSTQYSNMHVNPDEKFFVPENVYIIGTMNDIDRSVDSFDFAMRRRFRFAEIKAEDRLEMLDSLGDENLKKEAITRMAALNKAILTVDELNENYQIGASYFLKLKFMSFEELWTDCLYPLLQDYVRGMYDEDGILSRFTKAYGYTKADDADDSVQD